jgi:enamine deaminase RidA (YjgF/YER057c/UK114 family)
LPRFDRAVYDPNRRPAAPIVTRKELSMERSVHNPWSWQDQFGFSQGIQVKGVERVLVCAGQTSTAPDGSTLHPGDMRAQVAQALDNLEAVLGHAGMDLSNVVRLNYYATDVDAFLQCGDVIGERLGPVGNAPASTLLGISRLAFPDLLVEIEATAVA